VADAAVEDEADAELAARVEGVCVGLAEAQHRAGRPQREAAQGAEARDERVGQSDAEVGVVAHVGAAAARVEHLEREDGD
jgi:hypothetical protein